MPYRRTERLTARLAEDRELILAAACDVVRDGGFTTAKMASVAAAAGVGTGSLYRHFPSKAALFSEMLRAVCARELEVVQAVAATGGPAAERLGDAAELFALRALRSHGLAYSVIVEPMDPEVDQVRLDARRRLADVFSGLVAEGMAAGELPDQPAGTAGAALIGAILEALVSPLASPETTIPETVARDIRHFCLRSVGAAG
ncbi:MAG: TetR/AcrR family transcriptional regulator [Acidimicrobiia bacterium]